MSTPYMCRGYNCSPSPDTVSNISRPGTAMTHLGSAHKASPSPRGISVTKGLTRAESPLWCLCLGHNTYLCTPLCLPVCLAPLPPLMVPTSAWASSLRRPASLSLDFVHDAEDGLCHFAIELFVVFSFLFVSTWCSATFHGMLEL